MDKCRVFKLKLGPLHLRFNPVVTLASIFIIWGFVAWCMAAPGPALKELTKWKRWVTKTWTWLYIGTQDVWAVFIVVIFFSKYGKMKLGKEDEVPEFSDATYFTMLFAAGIGIGLFYFGVAEPIYHYQPGNYGNRYWARYTDNLRAQDAINVTFFHWGIHGWVVYVVVGLLLGFIAHRNDLPMTMRTCFHPLIGDRVYGIMGDIIDTFSVVCTMFGVCTSLGVGVIQLNGGLYRVNSAIKETLINQVIIIWGITAIATCSVISGMKVGIRRLSEICFVVGMMLLLIVFFYDDTFYILNVFTQSIGYYLQCTFGGAGLRMQRNAELLGMNDTWTVGVGNATEPYQGIWLLSSRKKTDMWFDLVTHYEGIGMFMSILSIIGIVLYFVTSSDSGSLIIDCLSANGDPEPPILQRIFWALTEGATATALLFAGGEDSLKALQTVSICAGLFYTIILNFMCVALWRAFQIAGGDMPPDGTEFTTEYLHPLYHLPTLENMKELLIAIFAPWWPLSYVSSTLNNSSRRWISMIVIAIPFYGWVILMILSSINSGIQYIAWAVLFGFFAIETGRQTTYSRAIIGFYETALIFLRIHDKHTGNLGCMNLNNFQIARTL